LNSTAIDVEFSGLAAVFQKRLFHFCVAFAIIAVYRQFVHLFVFLCK